MWNRFWGGKLKSDLKGGIRRSSKNNKSGFSLLEIILVLALIGGIASVILPNLRVTLDSQMSASIKNFSSQVHAAYDNAIFSGRMQRMVINIKTSEYWVEQAPTSYTGRPPLIEQKKDSLAESNIKSYLEILQEKEKSLSKRQSPYSSEDNPIYYTIRSIPVVQRKILSPVKWNELSDSIISKQSLSGDVVFAKFMSGLSAVAFEYSVVSQNSNPKETQYGYIYFLPDGATTPTSIQLATKNKENGISDNGPQYTLNINSLTGQINLLEGFQDANFNLSKK